nr:PREDICTED: uncharacterized protein LOC109032675 [Bemisia tabaci]
MIPYLIAMMTISWCLYSGLYAMQRQPSSEIENRELYLEIPSSNRQRPAMYTCQTSKRQPYITCSQISDLDTRIAVYSTVNFFVVTDPRVWLDLKSSVRLGEAKVVPSTPVMLGIRPSNPVRDFFFGSAVDVDHYRADAWALYPHFLDGHEVVGLVNYYAVNDFGFFSKWEVRIEYITYVSTLRRVLSTYKKRLRTGASLSRLERIRSFRSESSKCVAPPVKIPPNDPVAAILARKFTIPEAIAFLLQKMIDPCAIMNPGDFPLKVNGVPHHSVDDFCSVFCRFIDMASKLSRNRERTSMCSSLGGTCEGSVCICKKPYQLSWCPQRFTFKPPSFLMLFCNNLLRAK